MFLRKYEFKFINSNQHQKNLFVLLFSIKKTIMKITIFLFILLTFQLSAQNPGVLDASFGNNGKVITSISSGIDKAYAVKIQSDGKIVVAGSTLNAITGQNFFVARYTSSGTSDISFGNNGIVETDLQNGSDDVAYSLDFQSNGKIVIAGYSDNGSNKNAALVRFNQNGTIDSTFGTNGIVLTDFENSQQDEIKVIKINPLTDDITVGGSSIISTSIGKPVVARYSVNGALDLTFNATGIKLLWVAVNDNFRTFSVEDLVVESNGKISCVGYRKNVAASISIEYWAARILSSGAMDLSFSTDGVVQYSEASGSSAASGMLLNAAKDFILCGSRQFNGNYSFRTLKINQNGTISNPSISYTNFNSGINKAYEIREDINGNYVFIGHAGSTTANAFTLGRINNSDLLVDPTFGTNGFAQTTFGNSFNEAVDLAVQSDNKIVAVGFSGNDIAIARFLGTLQPELNNFSLLSPANSATNVLFTSVQFDWSDAFGATNYEFVIDTISTFTSAQTFTTATSTYTLNSLLPNKTYYWKVRSSDGTNWGNYATTWNFTTNSLENFNLVSPSNNAINTNFSSQNFDWTDNNGATSYQLFLDTLSTFASVQTYTTATSSYSVSSLLPSTTYFWKVRASNGVVWGDYSQTWNFTTKQNNTSGLDEYQVSDILIYPNPTHDNVWIQSVENLVSKTFIIVDEIGKTLYTGEIGSTLFSIDLAQFLTGVYFLQIEGSSSCLKISKIN